MPASFNIIDEKNIILGDAKLLLPVGDVASPMRNVGKLQDVVLNVESTVVDLQTQLPEFVLKRYLLGQNATITAQAFEPFADGNLELFTGLTPSPVAALTGDPQALTADYTAGDQTFTLVGDLTAELEAGNYLKVKDTATTPETIEYVTIAKVELSGLDTLVTLALADTMINNFPAATTEVSRSAFERTGLGRFANVSGTQGQLLFEEFSPAVGGTRKVIQITGHRMTLPTSFELALTSAEFLQTPIEIVLLADPDKPNGQTLGYIDIYDQNVD